MNNQVIGMHYIFKIRSYNSLGFSDFSDVLVVALGPLPSKPDTPFKALQESKSSPTSIFV